MVCYIHRDMLMKLDCRNIVREFINNDTDVYEFLENCCNFHLSLSVHMCAFLYKTIITLAW